MLIKVDVTQEIIDNARPGDCQKCALAVAIQNALPKTFRSAVGLTSFSVFNTENNMNAPFNDLPRLAVIFRQNFDQRGKKACSPCCFEINIPDELFSE